MGEVRRWRRPAAVAGALLALTLVMVGLPRQASQAVQGQQRLQGVPWAGALKTDSGMCSVTVVDEWLAITAKHCGSANPSLKLNVSSVSIPGRGYAIKTIMPHPDLDVQAIFLRNHTGLPVTPLRESVRRDPFYAWGYGEDRSGAGGGQLARAEFNVPQEECQADSRANVCWAATATNCICNGDSGGPVTENGAIIGMLITGFTRTMAPTSDCGKVYEIGALTIQSMQPWLGEMIQDANRDDEF